MLQYESYQTGKPLKLIIFLHGYNGTVADHQYALDWLCEKIKDAVVIIPHAPEVCDKNPLKSQWFGMLKYDPDGKRMKPETSTAEIFAVYNAAAVEVQRCANLINNFIDEMQKKFSIADDKTYLIGFSQGAMLTIYTALNRNKAIAGAFSLSGLIAGADLLDKNIKSTPKLYLFHGEEDKKVQYKTLEESLKWLQNHHINPVVNTYSELAHKMCEPEVAEAARIMNQK
jgi:phospholipase/carboxylesterase